VWACGRGQTDRETDTQMCVTTIHFASFTTYVKCNYYKLVTATHGTSVEDRVTHVEETYASVDSPAMHSTHRHKHTQTQRHVH